MGELLTEWGVPIVTPIGGHAIFLDAKRVYPHIPQDQFPAQILASELYLDSNEFSMVQTSEAGDSSQLSPSLVPPPVPPST